MKSSHQVLYPATPHPVMSSVHGAKEQDPSVQSSNLILPFTRQSVRGVEERRRQSVYSLSERSSFAKEIPMEVIKQKDVMFSLPPEEKEE